MSKTLLGVKLYEQDGEFIKKCENLILEHGISEWRHHPYTDTMVLKEKCITPSTASVVPTNRVTTTIATDIDACQKSACHQMLLRCHQNILF